MKARLVWLGGFAALLFLIVGYWLGRSAPDRLGGEELQAMFEYRLQDSSTYWKVYEIADDHYCLESPRFEGAFAIANRFCVSRDEVRIENGPGGETALDYVRVNQIVLLENRYPGATEVRF